jgi:hypothetical protein
MCMTYTDDFALIEILCSLLRMKRNSWVHSMTFSPLFDLKDSIMSLYSWYMDFFMLNYKLRN